MPSDLTDKAIRASLSSDWQEAIRVNKKILAKKNKDISALNRLAYAYSKIGDFSKAEKTYKKVLKLNPYSAIAKKNLDKIKSLNKKKDPPAPCSFSSQQLDDLFLNEPGKTKIISLINLAPFETLSTLTPSQQLKIIHKKRSIVFTTLEGNYIGALPDNLSFQITKLIKGGNCFEANVHSVKKNCLKILLRETKRASKFKNQASFI